MSNFATVLTTLRKNKRLTQEDMARFLEISRPGYTRYEQGTGEPTIERLIQLADFFSVSLDELVGRGFYQGSDELKKVLLKKQVDTDIKGIIKDVIKDFVEEKEEEIKDHVYRKLGL